MLENIIFLISFLGGFLIFFKLIKDSEFPRLFKQGKTTSIIIASILSSLILAFLFATMLVRVVDVIKTLINN